ncbi:hypothetical protein CcCBS67573_g05432 [Chytriomyces confervae]|uniref:ABC transporter domain-containing protein n=1 Tax=Chytriomyces confervae TaxID=246404 RepID=A0A507FC35_9FUNG|nr:hypothetical protein CcCBS67573_g05432 [Chytriomyces confervae]
MRAATTSTAHRPKWPSQLRALTVKNTRLVLKKPMLLLLATLAPLVTFVLIAQLTEMLLTSVVSGFRNTGSATALTGGSAIPSMARGSSKLYFMSETSKGTEIMNRLCAMTGMQMGSDVISLGNKTADYNILATSIFDNFFALEKLPVWGVVNWGNSDTDISYTISTVPRRYDLQSQLPTVALQQALDAAILSLARSPTSYTPGSDSYQVSYDFFKSGSSGVDTLEDLQGEGEVASRVNSNIPDINWFSLVLIATMGSLSFIPLMSLVIDIVSKEKQRKLLGVLRRMGLMESAYWISVMIPMIFVCVLVALGASVGATLASSRAAIFKVTFEVLFIIHFCYALAIAGLGCAIASCISRPLFINLSIGLVTVACIVVNLIMFISLQFDRPIPPTGLWFTNCEEVYAKVLLFLFAPFFNYGRIWADISIYNDKNNLDKLSDAFDFKQLTSTTRVIKSLTSGFGLDVSKFTKLPPTGVTALLLFLNPFAYLLIAWYLNQALPSLEGFSRGAAFPFMPSYWTGKSKKRELSAGDTLASEKEKSRLTSSVRMIKMSKSYKGVTAVKEFSSVFECGKVYSVLGHNGAGKSTLINMLSLGTSPTYGDCFMFGMDIREDSNELQNMMSLCPQFDVLYPSLTPNQHLQFYYSFRGDHKGFTKAQMKELFFAKLSAVNLADVADVPCGRFSGGMKRRLSLCLATVAESAKIVFLDEPTTGLDPISRRGVWKVIQELKKDRVVILTTHSMHEADALGDHVCIMHQGRLRASGSSLFLKNKFGEGYQVTLVNRNKLNTAGSSADELRGAVESYVKYALPRSSVVSSAGGALTVAINKIERGRLVSFLRALKKDELMDWSIGNSTLEEVFLKLSTQNKEVVTDAEGNQERARPICRICAFRPTEVVHLYTKAGVMIEIPDVVCKICAESVSGGGGGDGDANNSADDSTMLVSFSEFLRRSPPKPEARLQALSVDAITKGRTTIGSQLGAVMVKNGYLHSKERKVNICFVVFLILFVAISVLAGRALPAPPPECTQGVFYPKDYSSIACDTTVYAEKIRNPKRDSFDNQFAYPINAETVCNTIECAGGRRLPFSFAARVFSVLAKRPSGSSLSAAQFSSGIPGLSTGFAGAAANVKFTQNKAGDDLDVSTFFASASFEKSANDRSTLTPGSNFERVDSASVQKFFLSQQDSLASKRSSLSQVCKSYTRSRDRLGVLATDLSDFSNQWNQYYPDLGYNVNRLKVDSSSVNINFEMVSYPLSAFPPIFIQSVGGLPSISSQFTDCVAVQHSHGPYDPTMNPTLASFDLMVVSINSMTNKALKALNAGGISSVAVNINTLPEIINIDTSGDAKFTFYKLGRAVFVMFFILATGLVYPRIVSLLVLEKRENLVEMMRIQGLSLPSYWAGNYLYAFGVIFMFNLLYTIICVAAGIPQVMTAGIAYMLLVIVLWTHGQVCLSFLIGGVITKPTSSALLSYLLYVASAGLAPFLTLSVGPSGFSLAWSLFPVTGVMSLLQLVTAFGVKDVARIALNAVVMFTSSSVLALLGMYVHAIRPSAVGIPLDPLMGLSSKMRGSAQSRIADKDVELSGRRKDQDVYEHEQKVQAFHARGTETQPAVDPNEALRIVHLRKVFGKDKVAVEDMTLSFKLGETFGMLGPNGAGKTTALNMMTGLLKRTSGSIVIAGESVAPNKNARTDEIGVTPQFDTVWPDMTVEEHLKFYCRLRGVPKKAITGMVRSIAESIELDGDAFKQNASGLSGGMRRRLSIGIALTANPKILVLDEPTTGLDPETRRQIWKIVERIRGLGDKCVIITTHSMDEADALCTRIGIVVDGAVRVLGDQLTLKRKFNEGLKFTFRFTVKCPTRNEASLGHFEYCEKTRIREISSEIQRATRINDLKWNLISSDLIYAHANAAITPTDEASWMVSLQCVATRELDIASVFLDVSQACERLGVGDWALNETTLEDVFVRVVGV